MIKEKGQWFFDLTSTQNPTYEKIDVSTNNKKKIHLINIVDWGKGVN